MHHIPPGPYCPPYVPGRLEVGAPVIIVTEEEAVRHEYLSSRQSRGIMMSKLCTEHGIPTGVRVPLLVWHLTHTAACANLNPWEKSRCWELARLVLAEASERMHADKPTGGE